jgi:hypothetical protein
MCNRRWRDSLLVGRVEYLICMSHNKSCLYSHNSVVPTNRLVHIGKSQQAKNCNLSRIISNLICLKKKIPSTCLSSFWVHHTFLTCTWLWQTDKRHSSSFFTLSILLHIVHIRLSFGIVHSIRIYSTISKITGRPREIGTGGTGVTSNHDIESNREAQTLFSTAWSEPYRMIDSWFTRQHTRS